MDGLKHYSPLEEKTNIISHAIGLVFSIVALVLMVIRASLYGNGWHVVSVSIFGASLIALYAASTIYHSDNLCAHRRHLYPFHAHHAKWLDRLDDIRCFLDDGFYRHNPEGVLHREIQHHFNPDVCIHGVDNRFCDNTLN